MSFILRVVMWHIAAVPARHNKTGGGRGTNQYQTRGHSVSQDHCLDVPHPNLMSQAEVGAPAPVAQLPGRWRLWGRMWMWAFTRVLPTSTGHMAEIAKKIDNPWLLDRLAHDEHLEVAAGVALNMNLPAQTAQYLAGHDSDLIRSRVAMRHDLSAAVMDQLARDEYSVVRGRIAQNVSAPSETLTYIVRNDPNSTNRQRALRNPACPPQLKALAAVQGALDDTLTT